VRFGLVALAFVMACGRIGFDERGDAPASSCTAIACMDTTFAGSGVLAVSVDGVPNASFGDQAVAVQPDDRIVVVGKAGTAINSTALVVRLDDSGAFDPSFGSGGIAEIDQGAMELMAVAVAADGTIAVAGGAAAECLVSKLSTSGVPVPTFGVVITGLGASFCVLNGVATDAAGRVIVGGQGDFTSFDLVAHAWLAAGGDDASFTGLRYDGGRGDEFGSLAGLGPDGGLDLIGDTYNGADFDGLLVHATNAGVLDPSFGSGGVATIDLGASEQFFARARAAAGGFVATGSTGSAAFVARFSASGVLDSARTAILDGAVGRGVVILADGRTVVGLRTATSSRLVVLDPSNAVLGTFDLPIAAPNGIDDLLLDRHGRVVIYGDEGSGELYLARVLIP
jgi:uncharacterized delta-60 repeat protein